VLYSHRSNVLHALMAGQADAQGLRGADSILPIVPMFHANAWALAFAAPMTGAKLVMPGARLDGAAIYELLENEKVTLTAAVPTVWLALLQYLEQTGKTLPHLRRVLIGGSACPRAIVEAFERTYDVDVCHAWGMTEMSPLGSLGTLKAHLVDLPYEEKLAYKLKQGHPPFGVEMKIVNDNDDELPRDGNAFGRLKVRGPAVAKAYFRGDGEDAFDDEGWFDTGDVATLDRDGYMTITDRAKDVIKSGGEWISSIEIENIAVGHPAIAEAAVIGVTHPKWDERPLLIVVPKPGRAVTKDEILHYLDGKIAKWWMPDDVIFADEIPHTATGKIQKTALRERYGAHPLPTAAASN
jgi:fatty-acyl-CoA synthase